MRPEILAPVGGAQQLAAALRCGADAVYFGAPDFNARRKAENFAAEDFLAAVAACHVRGAKAYITLNTLVKDAELPALRDTVRLIAQSGADAVIVQDPGVAAEVRRLCPDLALHASTQMAVHNTAGVRMLEALGFSRVVPARELSLAELRALRESTELELEVFVHGAHCMSVSGLCYTSSVFGCRSGNRGLCAQPCRLDFRADGRDHALSLKDMSLLGHLRELAEIGVDSFKIEGRMKRPEYVAAAVTAVRHAENGEPYDLDALQSVFSRSGFTDGYLTGKRDLTMFGSRTKEDVTAAAGVLKSLQALYKDEAPRVPVTMRFSARADAPCALTLSDGANAVTARGPVPEAARNLPLTPALCGKSLLKLGGTPYACDTVETELDDGLMLPAAALNALRRDAVAALDALRAGGPLPVTDAPDPVLPAPAAGGAGALRLRFETADQICMTDAAERVILPLREIAARPDLIGTLGDRLAAELPVLIWPGDEAGAARALADLREKGLRRTVCENAGAIMLTKEAGLIPTGGAHLNILNRLALLEYEKLGVGDATLSFELRFEEIERLRGNGKTGFLAYGRLPLMRFRACPARGKNGCGSCTGRPTLRDRYGAPFTLLCADRRYSTMLNPIPVYTGNVRMPATDFYTLYFTEETRAECAAVTEAFLNRRNPAFRKTLGLYDKTLL